MKPAMPAVRPWCSACWPSVADTCDELISSSLIGSAPVFSRFARFWAEVIVKPPSICDPLVASMPSGFCWKSMYGVVMSLLSSTTAKCWKACCAGWPGICWDWPRWAIARVVLCQILRPVPVKLKVTIGALVPPGPLSKFCSGLLMSVPRRAKLSLRTNQRAWLGFLGWLLSSYWAWTTVTPGWTIRTLSSGPGDFSRDSENRSASRSSGPPARPPLAGPWPFRGGLGNRAALAPPGAARALFVFFVGRVLVGRVWGVFRALFGGAAPRAPPPPEVLKAGAGIARRLPAGDA